MSQHKALEVHYDIRAITGVTRAACGIDNHIASDEEWNASNNRNVVTCEACRQKIDLLAIHGGDLISVRALDREADFRVLVDAVKQAVNEVDEENDEENEAWHRDVIKLALEEHSNDRVLSEHRLITKAVHDAIKEGLVKFDDKELRGAVHQVLNARLEPDMREILRKHELGMHQSRTIELTRIINAAFNRKLAEASYIVGKDFMESDSVRNRLVGANNESLETFLEDQDVKDALGQLMKEAVEEALADNPMQFVQNVYSPQELDAVDVYRQTKGLLQGGYQKPEPEKEAPRFDTLSHQQLGPWAIANDIVAEYHYDTNLTRRLLQLRLNQGRLIWPGEDEPRG